MAEVDLDAYYMGPDTLYLPCGGEASPDPNSSIFAYRCEMCGAVVGSIGQPKECRIEREKYEMWGLLGGMKWDYTTGKPSMAPGHITYAIKKID